MGDKFVCDHMIGGSGRASFDSQRDAYSVFSISQGVEGSGEEKRKKEKREKREKRGWGNIS